MSDITARRVLMIVHSEFPVGEPRVRRQAEAAASAGWRVDVLALASPGALRAETLGGVHIYRSRVTRERRMTTLGLISEYGRFFVDVSKYCCSAGSYDAIVVANPPDFLVFATLAQRMRGSTIILDIHDLMTDLFSVRMGLSQSNVRYRLISIAESISVRFAQRVITVHQPYAAEIARRSGGRVVPTVVMNSADDSRFRRRDQQPQGPLRVVYHGSLLERYGVIDLVRAYESLHRAVPNSELWLAGDGDARQQIRREIEGLGLRDAVWLSDGMLPVEEICALLPRCHLGVIPNQPNRLNRYALSTKLFEYVATGIPVVCAGLPTLRSHFSPSEVLFFSPGDVDDMAAKLRWAAEHYVAMIGMAEAAYERYEREYSWPRQKAIFLDVLRSCAR